MNKKSANLGPCLKPSPKTLVSVRGLNGENNALVVAYCCNCSYDPPMVMVGIVPSRYSYQMVKDSKCFVVNLANKNNKTMFDYLGSHSGRDGDKLAAVNAKLGEAVKIDAPILEDCPVNIECSVIDSVRTGSHEMLICSVAHVHADAELLNEDGDIDFNKIDFL